MGSEVVSYLLLQVLRAIDTNLQEENTDVYALFCPPVMGSEVVLYILLQELRAM